MTLQDLHDALGQLLDAGVPPDTEIVTEGCDCDGDVGEVVDEMGATRFVYLKRLNT